MYTRGSGWGGRGSGWGGGGGGGGDSKVQIGKLFEHKIVCLFVSMPCIPVTSLDRQKNQRKIVNIFLAITFSICFGCSKEPSH